MGKSRLEEACRSGWPLSSLRVRETGALKLPWRIFRNGLVDKVPIGGTSMEVLSANVVPACGTTELDDSQARARHSQHAHLKCICFQITPREEYSRNSCAVSAQNGL
jgi:hypothetical protein